VCEADGLGGMSVCVCVCARFTEPHESREEVVPRSGGNASDLTRVDGAGSVSSKYRLRARFGGSICGDGVGKREELRLKPRSQVQVREKGVERAVWLQLRVDHASTVQLPAALLASTELHQLMGAAKVRTSQPEGGAGPDRVRYRSFVRAQQVICSVEWGEAQVVEAWLRGLHQSPRFQLQLLCPSAVHKQSNQVRAILPVKRKRARV